MTEATDDDRDWRLQAELAVADRHGALRGLLSRLRDDDSVVGEIESGVPKDVVVTHDGKLLFAYACDRDALRQAQRAIEQVLAGEDAQASIRVSHWDADVGEWLQVEPPLSDAERAAEARAKHDAQTPLTQTFVSSSGKLVRAEFERTMGDYATQLGVECKIVEHPHVLSTQVAFTVTGTHEKVEEFARALKAEEHATIRTQLPVVASPL